MDETNERLLRPQDLEHLKKGSVVLMFYASKDIPLTFIRGVKDSTSYTMYEFIGSDTSFSLAIKSTEAEETLKAFNIRIIDSAHPLYKKRSFVNQFNRLLDILFNKEKI
jgi:hypothetical protein